MENHVLLIASRDEKGLVHRVTGKLFDQSLNVLENGEFVDREHAAFFMRTEFNGQLDHDRLLRELRGILPENASVRLSEKKKKDIVLLATREHHCLGDLLLRHAYGELNARICAVVSQYDDLAPLARRFEVPFHCVAADGLAREEHETRLLKEIEAYKPEYLVLAKYMRILTPAFVHRFPNRIVNIHHSFLPAFVGSNPYRQAYERGVKIIGATAHFVNESLDEGPILTQSTRAVDHTHDAQDMAQAGRDVEKLVLADALKLVFEERVIVHGNRTVIFG